MTRVELFIGKTGSPDNIFVSVRDNPTIGLVLCTDKNETIVKYSVLSEGKQIFASKYKLYLPNEESLKEEMRREKDLLEIEQRLREG